MDERDRIAREIDALLDVEPSADFVARVRETARTQPMARYAWLDGRWIAALASAALLVAAVLTWRAQEARWTPPPAEPVASALEAPAPIVIEPITITPLLTANRELGEHQ